MPNPASAYKAVKAAKAAAKAKMAAKLVVKQARNVTEKNYDVNDLVKSVGYDPYNSSATRVGAARFLNDRQPVTKMRQSRRMDAVYNLGRSKGMDPYNTFDAYRKAGNTVGANAARPKPGVKKKTTY